MAANGGVADFDFALVNFAERDTSEVIGVIEIGHEHLEAVAGLGARRRNVLHDGVEERFHRAGDVFEFGLGIAQLGGTINEREIQLLIRRVQRHEEFKHLVEHFFRIGVFAVNLVDDHNRLGAGFERLAEHEARLRLRAFGGIHDEQHAVNHVHDALDLAAEVGVAGSVHDIDVVILVFEGGVFGADRNALFLFQVHRVHQAFLGRFVLVGAEGARLLEQAVHQSRFAMINVRDDGDVADVLHIVNFRPAHNAQYTRRDKGHEWESGGFAGVRIMDICRQRSSHACKS